MSNRLKGPLLIADQHPLTRIGLIAVLKGDPRIKKVVEAASLDGATSALSRYPSIEFLVVDFELPGLRGAEGIRFLRNKFPGVKIVVLASWLTREEIFDVLSVGVHGCVSKVLPGSEMLAAFQVVMDGRVYVPAAVSELKGLGEPPSARHESVARHELTGRQVAVLELLAKGMSSKEIAESLQIAEGTVKVHLNAAYRALGVHDRISAITLLEASAARGAVEPQIPGLIEKRSIAVRRRIVGLLAILTGFASLPGYEVIL